MYTPPPGIRPPVPGAPRVPVRWLVPVVAALTLALPGCRTSVSDPINPAYQRPIADWWPAPRTSVPSHPRFVVTLYPDAARADLLPGIIALARAGLVLRPQTGLGIPLVLQRTARPLPDRAQLVLVPVVPLDEAGVVYRLRPKTPPATASAKRAWHALQGEPAPRWTATGAPLRSRPGWRGRPTLVRDNHCGYLRRLFGRCRGEVRRHTRYLLRAPLVGTVADIRVVVRVGGQGEPGTPWIVPRQRAGAPWLASGDEIELSNGGFDYSGFRFFPGRRYAVHLAAVDVAGQVTPAPGPPLHLTGFANPGGTRAMTGPGRDTVSLQPSR